HAARRDCHSLIFATSNGPQTPSAAAIIAASIKADIVGRPGRRGVMSSEHAEARDDCREDRMTAALKPPSLLRTATGEPPRGRKAEFFATTRAKSSSTTAHATTHPRPGLACSPMPATTCRDLAPNFFG